MTKESVFDVYTKEVDRHSDLYLKYVDKDSLIYEIKGVDGSGIVEVLTLYPGIIIQFHNFHCRAFRFIESEGVSNGLKLNFCAEGRMEVRMSDQMFLFMEPGNFSVDVRKTLDSFIFPSEHYHGIEILIHNSAMDGNIPSYWVDLGIDLKKIEMLLDEKDNNCIIKVNDTLKCLFQAMQNAPKSCKLNYLRVKVTELFLLLCSGQVPGSTGNYSLMTLGQVQIAKRVMEKITYDLSRHYSIESMAKIYGVSASSVKNYFRGVYGKNISVYLREIRMNTAAKALSLTNRTVSDIASGIGYENVSKFAAAFRNFIGESPLEYRRQSRCGI